MNFIISTFVVLLFCIDYYHIYYYTKTKTTNLTERQRAYIMSIKASLTLFILGLISNFSTFEHDNLILNLGILNLIAYFLMDCTVGYFEYHKYLCSLSGYFHHFVYLVISILSIKLNVIRPYMLFFVEELPTLILSIGNFNNNLRSDNLFGLTFFITRIVYHLILIGHTYKTHILFVILGVLSFGLHSYWFKNWLTKYYTKKR